MKLRSGKYAASEQRKARTKTTFIKFHLSRDIRSLRNTTHSNERYVPIRPTAQKVYLPQRRRKVFDAPKMHVFTHLLRKCFTDKSKVRLRPPKCTIYGGSKWPLFTPKTAWIKIV